ncbi:MAG TPA: phosphatidate cytidylyltransferase [Burkholderiales bacterium]|nr:phosphatidate cytidylyltransferase [Burkholderiales bacterium]
MFNARLATALILLAAFVAAALVLPNRWWAALLLIGLAVAGWEWGALAGSGRMRRALLVGVLVISASAIGLSAGSSLESDTGARTVETAVYGASMAFWLLLAAPWLAQRWQIRSRLALEGAGWIVLVPTWLALARMQSEPGTLLALLGIIWIADTAAYVSGKTWGRHLLAPRISPAKTWEGVAGACAAVAVYYGALSMLAPEWRWVHGWSGVVLFAGITLMSIVGDLYESWMKRQAGVKDSGALLPGHGGLLDRIDSMCSSMPFAALLLHQFR